MTDQGQPVTVAPFFGPRIAFVGPTSLALPFCILSAAGETAGMSKYASGLFWLMDLGVLLMLVGCASTGGDRVAYRVTHSHEIPWVELKDALGYNGSEAVEQLPEAVDRIDRVLRNRAVFRREGIGFGQLMLGSRALYPYHSHASPGAYHVISGEAEWTVDGETRRIGPGTSIYHAPYADHRWTTTSDTGRATIF